MHRFFSRLVPLVALSLVASGCGSSSDNTVTATGNITAQLVTLSPDSTKPVGLALGTWNGSICQITLPNDNSVQGSVTVGTASAVGDFCVRIYDAAGTVDQPQTYTIEVDHG